MHNSCAASDASGGFPPQTQHCEIGLWTTRRFHHSCPHLVAAVSPDLPQRVIVDSRRKPLIVRMVASYPQLTFHIFPAPLIPLLLENSIEVRTKTRRPGTRNKPRSSGDGSDFFLTPRHDDRQLPVTSSRLIRRQYIFHTSTGYAGGLTTKRNPQTHRGNRSWLVNGPGWNG